MAKQAKKSVTKAGAKAPAKAASPKKAVAKKAATKQSAASKKTAALQAVSPKKKAAAQKVARPKKKAAAKKAISLSTNEQVERLKNRLPAFEKGLKALFKAHGLPGLMADEFKVRALRGEAITSCEELGQCLVFKKDPITNRLVPTCVPCAS